MSDENPEGVRGVMAELTGQAIQVAQRMMNGKRAFHYQALFHDDNGELTLHGERVMADLARFCRANESTFDPDPRVHALLEGRRETFLRICKFLQIDSEEAAKYVEVKDE